VLRSIEHLRRRRSTDNTGLVVRIYAQFSIQEHNYALLVSVLPVLTSTELNDQQALPFIVPLIMLVPVLTWPLATATSRTTSIPLFGLPYADKRVALQIRSCHSFSTELHSCQYPAGELSSYCAGDFFELPVRNAVRQLMMVRVYFICAVADTTTKTWLVSPLHF